MQGMAQEEVSTFALLTEFNKSEQADIKKFQHINKQLQGVDQNEEEYEEEKVEIEQPQEAPLEIFKSDYELYNSQPQEMGYEENLSQQIQKLNNQVFQPSQQVITQQVVVTQVQKLKEKQKSQLEFDIEEIEKELQFKESQLLQLEVEFDQQKQKTMYGTSQLEIFRDDLIGIQQELPKLKKDAEKHNFLHEALQEPDPINKVKQEIQGVEQNLAYMNLEWDDYKKPIENEIVEKKKVLNKKQNQEVDLEEEIKQMKKDREVVTMDIQIKQEQSEFLQLQVEQIASAINKNVYVKRLQEIMKALKQQKSEMLKVVMDITNAQTEISKFQQEAVTKAKSGEEMAFLKAKEKQKSIYKDIYKNIIDLRDLYQALINEIQQQGEKKNNIRDLELKIDGAIARNMNNNITKLKQDLANLQMEQKQLLKGKKQIR